MTTTNLNEWSIPDLPSDLPLPQLPEIHDPKIKLQVFTHASLFARPRQTDFDLDNQAEIEDYEKLEHVGDAILGTVVSTLLHEMYPKLRSGPATILRSQLIRNKTLAELSIRYSLPDHLRAASAALPTVRAQESVQAAIFEAYIAGFYLSTLHDNANDVTTSQAIAFERVEVWLRLILHPMADWAFTLLQAESRGPISRGFEDLAPLGPDSEAAVPRRTPSDIELLRYAHGSTQRLNQYITGRLYKPSPIYRHERLGEQIWKVKCITQNRAGETMTATAITRSIKNSQTVAAWKLCKELGLK